MVSVLCYCMALLLIASTESYKFFDPPEIKVTKWRASYHYEEDPVWETDFEQLSPESFTIAERGSVFIVSQHVAGLEIVCNASYPIEWIFDQSEFADEDVYNINMKSSRESDDIYNPRNDRFIGTLQIFGSSKAATGNYTCQSVRDSQLKKSIFVFWEGESPPYLVLAGRTIQVQSLDNQSLVLPCYLSQPDIAVQLFKESKEPDHKFQLISVGSGVRFDSKVGFTLDIHANIAGGIFGLYKCVANGDDEDDQVHAIVMPGVSRPQFPEIMSPGTGVVYDQQRSEVVCCARGTRPPNLLSFFCSNPSVCRMLEHKFYKMKHNAKKSLNGSCTSEKVYPKDFGMLRCKGDGIDIFRHVYTDFPEVDNGPFNIYFDWRAIRPEKMMHLTIHDIPPFFHMQTVPITCEGMTSYFADGHKWAIRWKNESLTYYEPIDYIDDMHIHGLRNAELTLHWKMSELICFIPVWNSTVWINKTVNLDIKKSIPPQIDGPSVEETYMVLNETEKLIECKSTAYPPAIVSWKKNGRSMSKKMIIWKENGTSILLFHLVSHETQADYTCIAKNYAGQAAKLIRVFVQDNGSAWGVAAAVIIPILVVAFLVTVGFLIWKMQGQKKVVNHLSRIVFRDVEPSQDQYPT